MKIPRFFDLKKQLRPNKALILFGPRQVGKTTLLKDFLSSFSGKYRLDTGDDIKMQELFSSGDLKALMEYAAGFDLIAIDEAQRIAGIGEAVKILVDHVPGIKVIATGSSSFELAGQIGEPLTGRKVTLTLYPIAQIELSRIHNVHELKEQLDERLIFGSYPEVVTASDRKEKTRIAEELTHSYLLKDILSLERIKSSKILLDLLRLLAFQIGKEVSLSELGTRLGLDYKTVQRYLDLLEKSFVIVNVRGFSRNLRHEITSKSKYYFVDNGVRNAIISNFNAMALRNDQGELWENFVFMERLKKRAYDEILANVYFWRTWERQEIDLVEEREGRLFGYEIKWKSVHLRPPTQWSANYPGAIFEVISSENFSDFII